MDSLISQEGSWYENKGREMKYRSKFVTVPRMKDKCFKARKRKKKNYLQMYQKTQRKIQIFFTKILQIFKFGKCLLKFISEFVSSFSHVQT